MPLAGIQQSLQGPKSEGKRLEGNISGICLGIIWVDVLNIHGLATRWG